jgi:hypothetical protein
MLVQHNINKETSILFVVFPLFGPTLYIHRCIYIYIYIYIYTWGTRSRNWLRQCVIRRKVAGSISDEVIRFFSLPNPCGRTMAPGSTQSLTEMSTRNLPGSNGRTACKADNTATICQPISYKIWEP